MIHPLDQERVTIQTFADHPNATGYPTIRDDKLEDLSLWIWAENQKGMGIFYAVNRMRAGGYRGRDFVEHVLAYYVDIDGIPHRMEKDITSEELLASPLPPTSIIYTKNGVQALWAVDGGSLNPDEYKRTESGLIHAFHADPNAKDIARVLRLPGTLHQKNPDEPYLCTVMYQDDILYTEAAVRDAYPPVVPAPVFGMHRAFVGEPNPEEWTDIINDIRDWIGVPGYRHDVLLIAAGNAVRCGIPQAKAFNDLLPSVEAWRQDPRMAYTETTNAVEFAYNQMIPYSRTALRNRLK
jgi:hypothetical protein